MNDLDERILKRFKDCVAISNLKEEFLMKKLLKKQVVTVSLIAVAILSGGFWTVNAATNGKMVEDIKSAIYNTLKENKDTKVEGNSIEIQDVKTDENGNPETIMYTF